MTKLIVCFLVFTATACAPTRVLVDDCHDVEGSYKTCRLIKKL